MTQRTASADPLLAALREAPTIYDLAQPLHQGIPHSPNHPGFLFALMRRHGDMVRADGCSASNDLLVTGGHTGTHVDALAHVSEHGRLHGGVDADAAQSNRGFAEHGVDTLEPVVARGVLFDLPKLLGVERLAPGYGITAAELQAAGEQAGVELRRGDVALIRTGWAQLWADPHAFLGHDTGVPGPTEEAGRWLVERGIRMTGSDTTAFEQITAEVGHALLPVHRLLLVEAGIPIVEMLDLEALAAAGVAEFAFVLSPLKIVGGTGSPVRPLAVVGAA